VHRQPSHPATSFSPYGSGSAFGITPVWAIVSTKSAAHFQRRGDGWYAAKILWIVSTRFPSLVVIGVDGAHFSGAEQQIPGVTKARWRDHASTVLIRRPGCLRFRVGGPGLSRTITVRATTQT
jgi:hypothetical protein